MASREADEGAKLQMALKTSLEKIGNMALVN